MLRNGEIKKQQIQPVGTPLAGMRLAILKKEMRHDLSINVDGKTQGQEVAT
jgi:hypothetical protein